MATWSNASYRRRLGAISAIGLIGRLVYVPFERPLRIWSDEHWYITQAYRLFGEHPWSSIFDYSVPTASHGPLVSIVMSPIAALFPLDPNATAHEATLTMANLRYVVPFIGLLSILGIASVVRQVAGDRAALVAASLAVIYPGLWIRDGLVVSSTLVATHGGGGSADWRGGTVSSGNAGSRTHRDCCGVVAGPNHRLVLASRRGHWNCRPVVHALGYLQLESICKAGVSLHEPWNHTRRRQLPPRLLRRPVPRLRRHGVLGRRSRSAHIAR